VLTADLLLPDFLKEAWESRETYELDKAPVTVVDRGGLIAMKRIAGRRGLFGLPFGSENSRGKARDRSGDTALTQSPSDEESTYLPLWLAILNP